MAWRQTSIRWLQQALSGLPSTVQAPTPTLAAAPAGQQQQPPQEKSLASLEEDTATPFSEVYTPHCILAISPEAWCRLRILPKAAWRRTPPAPSQRCTPLPCCILTIILEACDGLCILPRRL